jgi:hypothetical protein
MMASLSKLKKCSVHPQYKYSVVLIIITLFFPVACLNLILVQGVPG